MAAITTTVFRVLTLAFLIALGAVVVDLEQRVGARHHAHGPAEPAADELKVVGIAHADALGLLLADRARLDEVLGLRPADRLVDAPGCRQSVLAARLLASQPGDFFELQVSRQGRPIRIVVLLH